MKKTTPSGTRVLTTSRPLGRTDDSMISPTGSGSAATSSSPTAISSIRLVVSRRRSISASHAVCGDYWFGFQEWLLAELSHTFICELGSKSSTVNPSRHDS